jgi:hypothetical protein
MWSFEFCEHFPTFGGCSGASSDPRWARRFIENFAKEGGQRGLPLGCLPLWGREGVNLTTTTEYLLNNSYIEDFSRAKYRNLGKNVTMVFSHQSDIKKIRLR